MADTHTAIWFLSDDRRLSVAAGTVLDTADAGGDQVGVSSITVAELVYLIEKGRIPLEGFRRLMTALDTTDSVQIDIPFDRQIARILSRVDRQRVPDLPDLPDRIIAATALHLQVPLISRDARIQASGVTTIW